MGMRRLDRRSLFTSATAAALLAASGLSADAAPRRGGRLRLAVPRDGALRQLLLGGVGDSLTEIAADGTLRPNLATGWEQGRAGWTFTLTRARFHDGTALTAAGVAACLSAAGLQARAAGPRTVTVATDPFDPGLPLRLAEPALAIVKEGATPVGTGPYRVERFEDERNFLLKRTESGHRTAGWADEVEAIVIPDAGVRAEALLDGHVDIAIRPEPSRLHDTPGVRMPRDMTAPPLAVAAHVGLPARIGADAFDNGRLIERWWLA